MNNDKTVGRRPAHAAPRMGRALLLSTFFALGAVSTTASSQILTDGNIKTDLGVEYQATGFYVQSDSFQSAPATAANGQQLDSEADPADSDNGFAQLLRLKAAFKDTKTGISVKTSIQLTGDRFTGQNRPNTTTNDQAFNTGSKGDDVIVDLAYLDVPFKYGAMRLGRQESNWNNCFLTCQDRRDRVLFITSINGFTPFFAFDRTSDIAAFDNQGNGDEIFTGFVTSLGPVNLGFLYVHFFDNFKGDIADTDPVLVPFDNGIAGTPIDANGDGQINGDLVGGQPDLINVAGSTGQRPVNPQSNLDIFSPYITTKVGPLNIAAGTNIFYDNEVNNNASPQEDDIFTDKSFSEYFRVGATLGMFDLGAQYVGTQDGGFVDTGFDTYSSLINNNPDSYQTATSVYSIGNNLGAKDFDENLYIGRVRANVSDQFYVSGALGFLEVKVPDAFAVNGRNEDTSLVLDLQAGYQFNDIMRMWTTLGMIDENDVGTLAGNGLLGTIPNGGSFEAERVVAGSVNLGVEF